MYIYTRNGELKKENSMKVKGREKGQETITGELHNSQAAKERVKAGQNQRRRLKTGEQSRSNRHAHPNKKATDAEETKITATNKIYYMYMNMIQGLMGKDFWWLCLACKVRPNKVPRARDTPGARRGGRRRL